MSKIILASGLLFLFVSAIRSKSLDLTMKPSVQYSFEIALLDLVAPLNSALPSFHFEPINVFWSSSFESVSTAQFPDIICSVLAKGSLNRVAYSIQLFVLLFLNKLFFVYFVCICCFSVQLSHTQSVFSRLLKVMIL